MIKEGLFFTQDKYFYLSGPKTGRDKMIIPILNPPYLTNIESKTPIKNHSLFS